ncbi:MAG TPA: DUF5995 family protein, partial [Acidimicrobiia bacterium]
LRHRRPRGALSAMTPASTREAADELRSIARSAGDAAGYFPALYARVTTEIAASIEAGRFDDGARMDAFATTFAAYYLRTWRNEIPRPRCWQASWDVAAGGGLLVVQHLLLGINAHVNHDLPQAVVEVADRTGDLEGVHGDFDAVNDVLAAASVGILRDLDRVSRWANEVAALGGGRAFHFSLRVARRQAWNAAERLFALDAPRRRDDVRELDRLVSVLAYLITRPAFPASVLVSVARRLEEHDPSVVVAALLGDDSDR